MPKLCAFGCAPGGTSMHHFPNAVKFPERFKTWVDLVGGKLETASDYEYYQKKLVCDKHFTARDRVRYNRLGALAIPSLHLHDSSARESAVDLLSQPSTSHGFEIEPSAGLMLEQEPPLIAANSNLSHTTASCPTDTGVVHGRIPSGVIMEHNYSAASRPTRKRSGKGSMGSLTCNDAQLKPFAAKLKNLQSEISRLRKRGVSYKARLANAAKLFKDTAFQHVIKNMQKPAQLFVHMQLQSAKKPKGRRFTPEEKVLALSMYKKSPKAYSLLYKYFTLPSSKAMKRLLSQIKLYPGINPILFQKIKNTVLEKDAPDRLCSLIFDEMSLTPQVIYNKSKDAFEGFANSGDVRFADHALVFMVKGLKQSFKQPVAYYFTNRLQKLELKKLIKCVVSEIQKSGLIIVNSVCDQSSVNVSAITELVNDTRASFLRLGKRWRHDFFSVNGQKIIPLYDVPHLIKGLRNNLLNKDMIYTANNENKMVKWEYYQQVYAADKTYGELRLLNKITEEHIVPEKINKMKVKSATQIFSHSVAVVTEHLVARGDLASECRALIEITLLLDNVFDSLNGNTLYIPDGKMYKGPIRRHSPHHKLWQKAKEVLKTVKFLQKKRSGNRLRLVETTIPSVTNFIKTINGMEAICKVLFDKYGFDAVLTRNFNQDPVENFFGNIRSYGARNNAPNTNSFEGAFKALLLNNYNMPQSRKANCEEDLNECLQGLQFFLTEKPDAPEVPKEENIVLDDILMPQSHSIQADAGQRNYVCGWVLKKCLQNIVKSCKYCRQNLLDSKNDNPSNSYIKAKEYERKKWLCYPSDVLQNCFHDIQNITHSFLKKDVPKYNVRKTIKAVADVLVDYPFNCILHKDKLKEYFTEITIIVMLHSWCRSINRILCGKLTYANGEDTTKIAAQIYYNKYKHYKNKK